MSKASDYDKMTPIEHILKRPDTYLGSTKITTNCMDVYDIEEKIIKSKIIKYSPGFLKIFDEKESNGQNGQNGQNESNRQRDSLELVYDFGFPLDTFQIEGIYRIHQNENILITAHTGSGKTVFAIYAIQYCLNMNKNRIKYLENINLEK